MKKRIIGLSLAVTLLFTNTASFAANSPYNLPKDLELDSVESMSVSLNEAIAYGISNSEVLEIVDNKVQLARVQQESTNYKGDELESIEQNYKSNKSTLNEKMEEITVAQATLDAAEAALTAGFAPEDVPVINQDLGLALTIPAGSHIRTYLDTYLDDPFLTIVTEAVIDGIEEELEGYQDEIDEKTMTLGSMEALMDNIYDKVITDATSELESMLDFHSQVDIDIDDLVEMMNDMATVSLNVTKYAEDVYRNQVAMLIAKNYYDALYAEKMVAVKAKAAERGKTQYEMVKLSYDNGMKAKDDFYLAKMYYDGTLMELRLAEATYQNAMYELKKNMNLNMDCDLTLEEGLDQVVRKASLEAALTSGMENRLEVQSLIGEMRLCLLNLEILGEEYDDDDFEYEEAMLLYENVIDQLALTQRLVSAEIHQSYELIEATGDMMTSSKYLVMEAEEVLKIAQLKYEQGFGVDNALLSGMGLEGSSGTILELIAAEENVIKMEAQVAQVQYNHTMARIKFLNDAGILTY